LNFADVKEAISEGCRIVINTDAHSTEQLGFMEFGTATARRGWAEAKDVANTYSPDKLMKLLKN